MARITDRFQPSFSLFPVNTNRTGYQPVNLPVLLVVPFTRTVDGFPIGDSGVQEVVFYIEDAPGQSPVAGAQNRGILVPAYQRFRLELDAAQLADVRIDPTGQVFYDQVTGEEKTFDLVVDGDLMTYTMLRGPSGEQGRAGPGPRDVIPYYQDAEYYDLSPFVIEVLQLPQGRYNFVWQCRYHPRVVSDNGEVICLDTERLVPARFASMINHPGEIHQTMIKRTPAWAIQDRLDKDHTVAFLRPFADLLQNIFDEQELLRGINWVDYIPIQYIPYLAYLLGLDLPYFPSATDDIRRAMLRNGRKLQQLKGSRRAIRELFEIFGFTIDIANLWYSKSGDRFIAPNEQLPDNIADQEITVQKVCHSEPALVAYQTPGFGQISIPLLFKPIGDITIDAYVVAPGSQAETDLQAAAEAFSNDVEAFGGTCAITIDGFQSSAFQDTIAADVLGHSRVLLRNGYGIDQASVGIGVVNQSVVQYDKDTNVLSLTLDHYFGFEAGEAVYVVLTYEREKIILPTALANLRSNRFDINILLFKNGEQPSSDIYEFLIEFLFKFKAFHSLLRKITFTVDVEGIYNVQDFCVGGRQADSASSTLGNLQTLPPIIPNDVAEPGETGFVCSSSALDRGFKDSDIQLRRKILRLLAEEHQAWKELDGVHEVPDAVLPILQSMSRLQIRSPIGTDCQFTQYGQDRVVAQDIDLDHNADDRPKLCTLDKNVSDYCYKGRVVQEVSEEPVLALEDSYRARPCGLSLGSGVYYLAPLVPEGDLKHLTDSKNLNRSRHDREYVRIMAFDRPQLHYSDRGYASSIEESVNNRFFAVRRPSLEIQKDNLFFPGHRFISLANLETDFTHPTYLLRPWDYLYDITCPEKVPAGVIIPDLHAHLVVNTNGDDELVYDQYPLIYYGNGKPADIPQLGDHSLSSIPANLVTHSIWSSSDPGLAWSQGVTEGIGIDYAIDHRADGLRFPAEALGVQKDTLCFSDILGPIFSSANRDCPCPAGTNAYLAEDLENLELTGGTGVATATQGADFIDGYPSEFGQYTVDITRYDFPREKVTGYGYSIYGIDLYGDEGGDEILAPAIALGVPLVATGEHIVNLTFRLGSGIRVSPDDPQYHLYQPYRLDCGCLKYGCEPTVATNPTPVTVNRCPIDFYQLPDGSYDFNPDRVDISRTMILKEMFGAGSIQLDGTIPNLFSFDEDKVLGGPSEFVENVPKVGQFQFVDDYGIIYRGVFETLGDRIDVTIRTQDPRVWGQEPTGEVLNRRVYRDGIISTERQIIQTAEDGYLVIAEGAEQEVTRFQTTFGCGDERMEDPFLYRLDYNITDDVALIVTQVGGTDAGDPDFGGDDFGVLDFGG